MKKIGINEPCPCGSGKKYKKCCGKVTDLTAFRERILDQEVDQLIDNIYAWFTLQWSEKIPFLLSDFLGESIDKIAWFDDPSKNWLSESEENDMALLVDCLLYDCKLPDGETVLNKYFQKERRGFRSSVVEVFSQWINSYVSVYELVDVTLSEDMVIVKDIFTDDKYKVSVKDFEIEAGIIGDIMVTRLLSKGAIYFISGFVRFPNTSKEYLFDKIERIKQEEMSNGSWQNFLKPFGYEVYLTAIAALKETVITLDDEIKKEILDEFAFTSEKQKEVAIGIFDNLGEEFPSEDVIGALLLWHKYCEIYSPRIQKVEVMVATIEYVVRLGLGEYITKSDIARKYSVSPSSISSRYRDFKEIMDVAIADFSENS
ncbi:MAG: SEC-C domain-containing protein [Halanaerobiales bacterium]|nr:SEC-C domain-containing protein [Halanaerobiales bacterium]